MKLLALLFSILLSTYSHAQKYPESRELKVIETKNYCKAYFIIGIDDSKPYDTLYFISLKYSNKKIDSSFQQLIPGNRYFFKISDMDFQGGAPPPKIADGYRIKFAEDIYIRREGRNGKTFTTTQYLSLNTNGLFILKREKGR